MLTQHTPHQPDTRRYRRWSCRPASRAAKISKAVAGAALCAGLTHPLGAQAEIFTNHTPTPSHTTGQTTVVLSDFRSDATPQTLIADPVVSPAYAHTHAQPVTTPAATRAAPSTQVMAAGAKPIPDKLLPMIQRVAREFALDTHLVAAVAATESGFNPSALSPKGAVGLMQLMPETAKRFGVRNIHAAEENLRGGAAYLRWLLNRFSGDLSLALAAYNAGENRVIRAGKVPDIEETQRYVPHVLALRSAYSGPKHQPWRLNH